MRMNLLLGTSLLIAGIVSTEAVSPESASAQQTTPPVIGAPLDSRTVPHPEWTQVSGEIQRREIVGEGSDAGRLVLELKAVEGGFVLADIGQAAQLSGVKLQDHDYVHVRGRMTEHNGRHY